MQIKLLLDREPFQEVLSRTLERFLPQITGRKHRVRWVSTFRSRDSTAQQWLCNHHLNAIFTKGASVATLEPVVVEFSRSSSLWRRPFQRRYVALASTPLCASLLAQARLEISPPLTDATDWLIVGGNHKIRLLNHRTQRCYSVLKEGFENEFLRAEVDARRLALESGVSVPLLREVANDGTWFLEDYVVGCPLNRLPNHEEVDRTLLEVTRELSQFSGSTSLPVKVSSHVESLVSTARENLVSAGAIDAPLRERIEACIGLAVQALEPSADDGIETVRSHGDFQPGNILWHRNGHWLIDWEYSAQRQAGHDDLVYHLRTRFPDGLADRLEAFVESGLGKGKERDGSTRRRAAHILCLEELELMIRENKNPLFTSVGNSFRCLVDELESWLRAKESDR